MTLPTQTLEVTISRTPTGSLTACITQEGRQGTNMLPGHCADLSRAMAIVRQKVGVVLDVTGQTKDLHWVLPEGEHVEVKGD